MDVADLNYSVKHCYGGLGAQEEWGVKEAFPLEEGEVEEMFLEAEV